MQVCMGSQELYLEDYKSIAWDSTRRLIAPMDEYSAVPHTMRLLQDLLPGASPTCQVPTDVFQNQNQLFQNQNVLVSPGS